MDGERLAVLSIVTGRAGSGSINKRRNQYPELGLCIKVMDKCRGQEDEPALECTDTAMTSAQQGSLMCFPGACVMVKRNKGGE